MVPPDGPPGTAVRLSARIADRVALHSPPTVGVRKAALKPLLTPDRWPLLPSIGRQAGATRYLDKRAPRSTLPPAEPTLAPVAQSWRAEIGAIVRPHEESRVGPPSPAPLAHSTH